MGRMTLVSVAIYAALFLVLWLTEWTHPELKGVLLQWSNFSWVVGIPASVLGTAYVLTIRNPKNYTGFYVGVMMSLLLAWQFMLQGSWDLVFLYTLVFVPFQIKSLVEWRRQVYMPSTPSSQNAFAPAFLPKNKALWTLFVTIVIVVLDYVIATKVMRHDGWGDDVAGKIASALMIAASLLANYWMIHKKNDAWLFWVIYCLDGLVMFIMIGNVFSIVMFGVMLAVNMAAQIAWIRSTRLSGFGWMGSREQMVTLLQRQEQRLMKQLEQVRARQKDIPTDPNAVVTKFGHIVDVVNRRIFDGCIEIQNGRIIRITEAEVPKSAVYILPGFYDSHVHIESTLLLPEYYARLAVEQGTIGAICDPHEIANVLGKKGVEYMIDNGKKVNFHFHFAASPCVPASPFETAGARLTTADIKELLKREEVYGLGEVMNVPGVLNKDPELMQKIEEALACGKVVDGHSPGLSGEGLTAYIKAGVSTDHECTTLAEARERVEQGMCVQVREGSAACDFEALAPIIGEAPGQVMFCTDDKYPDELAKGYINEICRRAVHKGIDVMDVLTAACVTPVKHYGLDSGLLQEGDWADFITVDNLSEFNLSETYVRGNQVVEDGIFTPKLVVNSMPASENYPNRFEAEKITIQDIQVPAREGQIKVIETTEGSLLTRMSLVTPKVENGMVVSDTQQDVLKIVCMNRYQNQKPVVGFVRGFGLQKGAMASTIAHDAHNIIAVGVSDQDIVNVINGVVDIKGGLMVSDGKEMMELMLPIAGLMSYRDGDKVARRHRQLKNIASRIGCKYSAPFMTLAFMSLSVIPELKLTDRGLFDGTKFEYTDLWA